MNPLSRFPQGGKLLTSPSPVGEGREGGCLIKNINRF